MVPLREPIDVVFSFDTTGSMYPCLARVRRELKGAIVRLFKRVPGIRIGVIAHGDYCDRRSTYVTKRFPLSNDADSIYDFVSDVSPTGGGDSPECYELVLHEARDMKWSAGRQKVLVLIGDDVPHPARDPQNTEHLDWKNEIKLLLEMGVQVYGVQALGRSHATSFYQEIARMTSGFHLTLDQFEDVTNLLLAICYKQAGDVEFQEWEQEVVRTGGMSRGMDDSFATLAGRPRAARRFTSTRSLEAVSGSRFQVMHVDEDQSIRDFVGENDLIFEKGRGFYEFTKTETIQPYKEIVLVEDTTGDMYTGEAARRMLGIPVGDEGSWRGKPKSLVGFTIFVQSTSYNRKLIGGTRFLYEVDMSR